MLTNFVPGRSLPKIQFYLVQLKLAPNPECRTTHPPLSHPGRFMGLLGPIVGILRSIVDYVRHQLSMGNTITAQFIRHDLPGFVTM